MELTTKEKEQESISGRTYIKDGVIIWTTDQSDIIEQLPMKDIQIIGEFTTSMGAIEEDWFFVLLLSGVGIGRG
jgi:hypothetical protein